MCRLLRSLAVRAKAAPSREPEGKPNLRNPAKADSSLTRRFTMPAVRKSMLTIAALALAGIFASTAKAQSKVVADAHFTLPFEAKWEGTVLPAGDYTMSVVNLGPRAAIYSVDCTGAGKKMRILAV